MKNKLKKLLLSLTLALSLSLGSFMGLANGLKTLSLKGFAEYKPTGAISAPYDFNDKTGWDRNSTNHSDFRKTLTDNAVGLPLMDLEENWRPKTTYDGKELTASESSLVLQTNASPVRVEMDKVDENNNYVYEKNDDGSFVFEKDEATGQNKVYHDISATNKDYEKVEGTENDFYKKIRETEIVSTYYGYKSRNSITLEASSYYVLTAYIFVKAAESQKAFATITFGTSDFTASVSVDSTKSGWQEVQLFVETYSDEKLDAYITAYYGNKEGLVENSDSLTVSDKTTGVAIFDHINVQKISLTEFINQTIDGVSSSTATKKADSARLDYDLDAAINADFNNEVSVFPTMFGEEGYNDQNANQSYQYYVPKYEGEKDDEKLSASQLANRHEAYKKMLASNGIVLEETELQYDKEGEEGEEPTKYGFNTFGANNKILKLENKSEKYALGVMSPFINIPRFGYYRVSVYVKSDNINASAYAKLLSYIQTGNKNGAAYTDGALQIATQSITSFPKDKDITNNWTELKFYVRANPYHDSTVQLAMLAGTNSTVYFDNIRFESISSSTYSKANSSNKLDLASSALVGSGNITNGYFNFIDFSKAEDINDLEAPYTPADWTKLKDVDKDVVSGIIPTDEISWDSIKTKIGDPTFNPMETQVLPGVELPKTNILAMYSETEKRTFGYKTNSFSLSSNSVYELYFFTYADNSATAASFSGNIFANLKLSDDLVAEFKDSYSNNGGAWVKHTIVVRTGSSSRTVTLEIGIEDAIGTAYFREVGYKKLESKKDDNDKTITVDDQFLEKVKANKDVLTEKTNNIKFVDFFGNGALAHSTETVEGKEYFKSLLYSLDKKANENDKQGEVFIVDTSKNLTLEQEIQASVLQRPDAMSNLVLAIYNKEKAASTVHPLTNISLSSSSYYQISFYVKTIGIEEGKGASVMLDAISIRYDNVNTTKETLNNGYTKYTIFVKTGSSSISNFNIAFRLGTTSNQLSGLVLVSDMNVHKYAKAEEYEEAYEAADKNDKNLVVKDFSSKSSGDGKNDPVTNETLATFFLVFSSILLVAALVIAIVAITIKKLPKSKTVIGTNNANVSKDTSSDNPSKDGFV